MADQLSLFSDAYSKCGDVPEPVRIHTTHALTLFDGLPTNVRKSGVVAISPNATEDQFQDAFNRLDGMVTTSTTFNRLVEGYLWIAITNKYGDGIRFLRTRYGKNAERKSIRFRESAWVVRSLIKKGYESSIDPTKPWIYLKRLAAPKHCSFYNKEEYNNIDTTIRPYQISEDGDAINITYTDGNEPEKVSIGKKQLIKYVVENHIVER